MAAPFVYVPEASPSVPQTPIYSTPQAGQPPFLPPAALLYPSSQYSAPVRIGIHSLMGAPFQSQTHDFVSSPSGAQFSFPSAHRTGFRAQPVSLLHARAQTLAFMGCSWRVAPAFVGEQRQPVSSDRTADSAPGASLAQRDAPSPIFHFDLAPLQFAPLRLVNANPPQTAVLRVAEIREPAFHPPLTSLRILHQCIPFWPIDLALPTELGDVLLSLHRALHERISHADWETLAEEDAQAVTKAFTQRCRAEAIRSRVPPPHLRDREVAERNQGVKRVDFLLGKTVFKGLVRAPGDPEGCVRMVTA
ncbi:hypothetical protein B0H11DRAFT_2332862 [Mycena galericulata]|nr:hypothetical protein B0H11DRAFT_2332862 [Mycena galericulata]